MKKKQPEMKTWNPRWRLREECLYQDSGGAAHSGIVGKFTGLNGH